MEEQQPVHAGDLERLTEPLDLDHADDGGCEPGEGAVDVGAPIVAGGEPAELAEPREGPFDPPSVSAEPGGRLDATARDAGHDGAGTAFPAAPAMIAGLVRVQLLGSLAGSPSTPRPPPRHGVGRRGERHAVVTVRPGQRQAERRAAAVGDAMPSRARTAAVRRVRPRLAAPRLAPMDAASSEARDQSNAPARSSRSGKTRCSRSHTPACCQSRRRRQQVMPEQPNTSRGSLSLRGPSFPTAGPSAGRTRSRAGHRDPPPGAGRPSASRAPRAATAPPQPTSHPSQAHVSWEENPRHGDRI